MGMKDSGINYGTPMNTGKKKPGDDDFDYTPSTPGAGVTVTADSYNTLEKKIIKAAKDDPSSNRASSSASLRQTSRGNTQTSGMTQAERDKVEQKVSGIQSASSRSGAVQTYERLKNLRKERRNAS